MNAIFSIFFESMSDHFQMISRVKINIFLFFLEIIVCFIIEFCESISSFCLACDKISIYVSIFCDVFLNPVREFPCIGTGRDRISSFWTLEQEIPVYGKFVPAFKKCTSMKKRKKKEKTFWHLDWLSNLSCPRALYSVWMSESPFSCLWKK